MCRPALAFALVVALTASPALDARPESTKLDGEAASGPAKGVGGATGETPQRATADDIHVFDPYIGRFRSPSTVDEASGVATYSLVEYEWFDPGQSIVRFTVSTVNEGTGAETLLAQGFYGYDPFAERLYAIAAFSWGVSGFGSVGEFDRETHRRVTWARSRGSTGPTTFVRDTFELVDEKSWRDVTAVREGEEGAWRVVYENVFTRLPE